MGWKDAEIDKVIAAGATKKYMYMQAGNGIVVPVLEVIFSELLKKDGYVWGVKKDEE